MGRHQATNAAVDLAVVSQLQQQGWSITPEHIRQGVAGVRWEGRMEVLSRAPWVLLDGAHTVEAALCLRQALTELFPRQRVSFILSLSTDKRIVEIIATLAPVAHEMIVTHFDNLRSCDPQALAEIVRQHGVAVQIESDPVVALAQTRCKAQASDVICVTGSLLLVGEMKARLQGLAPEF
jgi:dihydrofolate synthase/folylpolyglutamate synthase